jgi:hypothetical protein
MFHIKERTNPKGTGSHFGLRGGKYQENAYSYIMMGRAYSGKYTEGFGGEI